MTSNAEPGETCNKCGHVVRAQQIDTADIDGPAAPAFRSVCGCSEPGIDGPQVAD